MQNQLDSLTDSQLQMLLDAPGLNLFAVDCEYHYTSFNRLHALTMREIWGVNIALGMNILEDVILDAHDRAKSLNNFSRAVAGEELVLIEAYGTAESRRLYEFRYHPTLTGKNEIIGVTVFATDVTERIQLAEERLALDRKLLEASQLESLGLMVGCVAHDFNNLLVPILLSAQVAQSTLEPGHAATDLLSTVINSSKSAADLTKQLLNFSGDGGAANELIDLNVLISSTAELARVSVRRRAELVNSLAEQPLRIYANATQLRQVITNLLINASEAARGARPQVTVETTSLRVAGKFESQVLFPQQVASGDYAVLTVSDNGCGMTAEQLSHIFEPFYSTKGTGRGFGLTAVQSIVQNHKGFLAVDSLLGHGSTFRIGIPLAALNLVEFVESANIADFEISHFAEAPMQILIADDNASVLKCLSSICERFGHAVTPASGGVAAIVAISAQQFDLILIDAEMADISCDELLNAIPKFMTTPVALMGSDVHDAKLISNPRVHSILAKPFSAESLYSLLRRFKPRLHGYPGARNLPTVVR